jgi:hypothetical protein
MKQASISAAKFSVAEAVPKISKKILTKINIFFIFDILEKP